ncbi:MAG TPA: response regulator [Ktedonobacteraceae bacterium]|nr:response regulator [Ktedonobacteraceae bacterium]
MVQVGLLEDNARIANLCATMLQHLGHEVIVYKYARDCLQALAPLDTAQQQGAKAQGTAFPFHLPVQVLILDLHLPDIDGVEVLKRLRAHPFTKSLPLIFCTAATAEEIAKALRIAPDAVLIEKPFKLATLTSAISNALDAASN